MPLPPGGETADQLNATVPAPAVALGVGALSVPTLAAAFPEPVAAKNAVDAATPRMAATGRPASGEHLLARRTRVRMKSRPDNRAPSRGGAAEWARLRRLSIR